jgi:hypothetical protein
MLVLLVSLLRPVTEARPDIGYSKYCKVFYVRSCVGSNSLSGRTEHPIATNYAHGPCHPEFNEC